MDQSLELIEGGIHSDERGTIAFVNDFDLSKCVRFYRITHPETSIIRAWQGHQKESKWFHCYSGSFLIKLIKIDNWENPSLDLEVKTFELKGAQSQVLYIPSGYASGFKALENNSSLMVFSDMTVEESVADDFRFEKNYWFQWEQL
ncbi:dTDP-4-dehydrorhamnose 3,5-epimerase family protein [Saprospiraceae bacterium]|nr:dTDP-4-dehydrorhamnose 3,5-epimerase family protein [Saprospiraceae bacterium]